MSALENVSRYPPPFGGDVFHAALDLPYPFDGPGEDEATGAEAPFMTGAAADSADTAETGAANFADDFQLPLA